MQLKHFYLTSIIASSLILGACGAETKQEIKLLEQGRYTTGIFDKSAAEIVAFDETTDQAFVVNANSGKIDVLDSRDISLPSLNKSLDLRADLVSSLKISRESEAGSANSVTVKNGLMAVAVEANPKTNTGWVLFYKTDDLSFLKAVNVGALPDMVTFTPDGTKVVVANEAEPNEGYSIDPEGTVSVIDVSWDGSVLTESTTDITFSDFNQGGDRALELPEKVLLNGVNASVAEDLEPEYITVSVDSETAYVALQENNAIAEIDLSQKTITKIWALGFKDHSIVGNELDGNNKDKKVNIKSEAAFGMYMPDSIASMNYQNKTYILTANEGDDRADWVKDLEQTTCEASGFYFNNDDEECGEDIKLKDALDADVLDPNDASTMIDLSHFESGGELADTVNRLNFSYSLTAQYGDIDNDQKIDRILSYGARSFSIWDAESGVLVFDSGNDFETITAERYGQDFNQDNAEQKAEDRSDNKVPEPEALTVGKINDNTYAFIGLERMGGIMVYDITNPMEPTFVEYVNNRDMTKDPEVDHDMAGDLGPEGMSFVPADKSPTNKPMLIVASEVSGTTTFYTIDVNQVPVD